MKTNINLITKLMVMVTIGLMSVLSTKAQNQRMNEFQNEFSKYQTQYRDLMYNGMHKEAMVPLASCIAMLDTTTIFKVAPIPERAIMEQKGLQYYDQACCYALLGQKKQVLCLPAEGKLRLPGQFGYEE